MRGGFRGARRAGGGVAGRTQGSGREGVTGRQAADFASPVRKGVDTGCGVVGTIRRPIPRAKPGQARRLGDNPEEPQDLTLSRVREASPRSESIPKGVAPRWPGRADARTRVDFRKVSGARAGQVSETRHPPPNVENYSRASGSIMIGRFPPAGIPMPPDAVCPSCADPDASGGRFFLPRSCEYSFLRA